MRHFIVYLVLVLSLAGLFRTVHAQGWAAQEVITFANAGVPPQGIYGRTNYTEKGYVFFGDFAISGGTSDIAGFPRGSGQYLITGFPGYVAIARMDGFPFHLVSVDLAEFSTFYAEPRIVEFVGYRLDGSVVTIRFTTDGIIDGAGPLADFETFHFDASWSNLLRVDVPTTTYSMDNVVLGIPEPAAPVLWLLGAAALWGFRPSRPRPPGAL